MIEVYKKYYDVEIDKFVEILADLFHFKGLERRGDEYYTCCPFHANGQERTASASFKLTGDHLGQFYCFGCKTRGYLSTVLTKLFGDRRKAEHWLKENFKSIEKDEKRVVNKVSQRVQELPQEYELPNSLFTNKTDYFNKRGIPDELVEKFKLGYSPKRNAVIFPVFEDERLVFYQVRYLDKKEDGLKWFIPKDAKAKVFGKQHVTSRTVVVCESVFNALTCWKFGKQAVALFGARFDDTKYELLEMPCLKYIIAFDGDEAGRINGKELAKFLRDNGRLVQILTVNNKTDINDFAHLSKEEFEQKWQEWSGK